MSGPGGCGVWFGWGVVSAPGGGCVSGPRGGVWSGGCLLGGWYPSMH